MSTSKYDQERAEIISRMPLSRAMLTVISALIRVIDSRAHVLEAAHEEDYEPETCEACGGTGFIMVPSEVNGDLDGISAPAPVAPSVGKDKAGSVATGVQAAVGLAPPTVSSGVDLVSVPTFVLAPDGQMIDESCSEAPVGTPIAASSIASVPFAAAPVPSAPVPSAPVSSAPVPSAPVTSAPVTATPVAATPVTAAPVTAAPVTAAAPPAFVHIPPLSPLVPGYNSLGPNTAVPHPTNAVYCVPGADRYYSVTKGIRVGVYSGWQNTSPYVTGVASASYSRHRTMHAAYDAYCSAYYAGFVSYV